MKSYHDLTPKGQSYCFLIPGATVLLVVSIYFVATGCIPSKSGEVCYANDPTWTIGFSVLYLAIVVYCFVNGLRKYAAATR